jgi:hypothetical protein
MGWAATNNRPVAAPKAKRPDFHPAASARHHKGVPQIRKKRELRLLRGFLLLMLLLHLGHVSDPSLRVAVGRWSAERRGLSPWARPLTVNDHATAAIAAQVKNGKNAYISVA